MLNEDSINLIKDIMQKTDNCDIQIMREAHSIWFTSEGETELRLLLLRKYRLTISRVSFKKQRSGALTKILGELVRVCQKEKIEKILAQSVQTPAMVAFCIKNGFVPDPNASFLLEEIIYGDYILTV